MEKAKLKRSRQLEGTLSLAKAREGDEQVGRCRIVFLRGGFALGGLGRRTQVSSEVSSHILWKAWNFP